MAEEEDKIIGKGISADGKTYEIKESNLPKTSDGKYGYTNLNEKRIEFEVKDGQIVAEKEI